MIAPQPTSLSSPSWRSGAPIARFRRRKLLSRLRRLIYTPIGQTNGSKTSSSPRILALSCTKEMFLVSPSGRNRVMFRRLLSYLLEFLMETAFWDGTPTGTPLDHVTSISADHSIGQSHLNIFISLRSRKLALKQRLDKMGRASHYRRRNQLKESSSTLTEMKSNGVIKLSI